SPPTRPPRSCRRARWAAARSGPRHPRVPPASFLGFGTRLLLAGWSKLHPRVPPASFLGFGTRLLLTGWSKLHPRGRPARGPALLPPDPGRTVGRGGGAPPRRRRRARP